MALDLEALRKAYWSGPPGPAFDRVSTREERIANGMRILIDRCRKVGIPPERYGLGEHGALIGGPGKPCTRSPDNSRPMENHCEPRLAPPEWFAHDKGGQPRHREGDERLSSLIASYLAGMPLESKPSSEELRGALQARHLNALEQFWLHEVLSCATIPELRFVIQAEGLPFGQFVRCLHNAGVRRHDVTDWMNQFAVKPANSQEIPI